MKIHTIPENLINRLKEREEQGLFRKLRNTEGLIDFCSNDYLGLAREVSIHERVENASTSFKYQLNGSTGSRLIRGNSFQAEELEIELANFHQDESALLFNSGYDANLGFFSSVPQRNDTILYDKFIHASVHDGIRLSFAKSHAFKHNDIDDARRLIKQSSGQVYITVESLYSMDGDFAPLLELADLCAQTGALLVVDEAHANGVFGPEGRGLTSDKRIAEACIARIFTFGKALGAQGAVVVGSQFLKDYLINFARSFIYTTALPLSDIITIQSAYSFLRSNPDRREFLFNNIQFYKEQQKGISHLRFLEADGPVQGIYMRNNKEAVRVSEVLKENGFDIRAILSPTVPAGTERIRICIHSFNTPLEIQNLFELLKVI